MKIINVSTIPFSQREKTYVKLSYDYGYDQNGNYGKGNIGTVSIIDNGEYEEVKTDYASNSKQIAINKAHELGLNFVYVYYN